MAGTTEGLTPLSSGWRQHIQHSGTGLPVLASDALLRQRRRHPFLSAWRQHGDERRFHTVAEFS
jgi:hypothetical protein